MIRTSIPDFPALAADLERRFDAGVTSAWSEPDFDAFALAAFRLQFESIEAFRGFCEGRGRTPDTVHRWQDVPPVPTTAFKHVDLIVDARRAPELVFRTSGTTRGRAARGRHLVARASLYRRSLLPPFREHVLSGGPGAHLLSLIPSPAERPDSSLSFMAGAAADALASSVRWLVDGSGELDVPGWRAAVRDAASSSEPVVVLATSLALLHLVERLEAGPSARLPAGSTIMETGGFKGSGREIGRGDLHGRVERATGVPGERIVGEYGMTELLSQLYEPVLAEGARARGAYIPPPWLRARALDPMTLAELPEGAEGVLAFFDLANAGSVCHVVTEDLGSVVAGRVRLSGRAPGAEPRGCSRAMDELLSAARGTVRSST